MLTGPAPVVQRWWEALTERARALKAAGDPRNLGALRFDLAMTTDPRTACGADPLLDALGMCEPGGGSGLATALTDDPRCSRPVQAAISVPAATALGLAQEPGWLDGYGWISAPMSRQLLTVAELRKACVAPHSGQLIDLADRVVRPRRTPQAMRDAVRSMVLTPHDLRDVVVDSQSQHDPSPALGAFVDARDRFCDGPTGTRVPASRSDRDHDTSWPAGPTAAWNLVSRAARTHQLKHAGWRPVRDGTGTTWTSPSGQVVHVPAHHHPPDPVPLGAALPPPDQLVEDDAALLRPPAWADDRIDPDGGTGTAAEPPAAAPGVPLLRHGWSDEPPF